MPAPDHTRRDLIRYAAVAGVAAPVLAACGSGNGSSSDGSPSGSKSGDGSGNQPGAGGGGSTTLVATSDVPVGGGVILKDANVVVTQPAKGDFKAFGATCTHAGCQVSSVTDGNIVCPCHGSTFSVEDGSVVGGPAPSPLPTISVTVKGGNVVEG